MQTAGSEGGQGREAEMRALAGTGRVWGKVEAENLAGQAETWAWGKGEAEIVGGGMLGWDHRWIWGKGRCIGKEIVMVAKLRAEERERLRWWGWLGLRCGC